MTTKKHSHSNKFGPSITSTNHEAVLRPGGMAVQKRDDEDVAAASYEPIKIRVSYGPSSLIDLSLPPTSTFGKVLIFFVFGYEIRIFDS